MLVQIVAFQLYFHFNWADRLPKHPPYWGCSYASMSWYLWAHTRPQSSQRTAAGQKYSGGDASLMLPCFRLLSETEPFILKISQQRSSINFSIFKMLGAKLCDAEDGRLLLFYWKTPKGLTGHQLLFPAEATNVWKDFITIEVKDTGHTLGFLEEPTDNVDVKKTELSCGRWLVQWVSRVKHHAGKMFVCLMCILLVCTKK